MRVLLASNNAHKLTEVRNILEPAGIEVASPAELGITLDVPEDGATFEANAIAKAQAFRERTGMAVLADDSGLEVDALGGLPGVRSARYAGSGASDADRVDLLLRRLEGTPAAKRTARFVCAVALAADGRESIVCRGECAGTITEVPRGANGFGYDPIFVPEDAGFTMAQMGPEQKNRISHRARAFRAACAVLERPQAR